jgi:hypothetical protein
LERPILGNIPLRWKCAFPQALRSFYGGLAAFTGLVEIGERLIERGAEAITYRLLKVGVAAH